jgi:hypothetical protein
MKKARLAGLLAALALSGTAQAELFDRGGGMIYDDDRDITWLADWNYAKTSGYDDDGGMDWDSAKAWAAGLEFGGYSDWRLPTALEPDGSGPCFSFTTGCSGSELGHMFYTELGATKGNSILTGDPAKLALFTNMQLTYWSGTEYSSSDSTYAWHMDMGYGFQDAVNKIYPLFSVAVRQGDVAVVPEPEAYLLFLAGFVWLATELRRRRS